MSETEGTLAERTLRTQLDLIMLFADEHVLPRIDEAVVHRAPSANCVDVRRVDGVLVADWPDESASPLPETTIAWLLWHIEWWWSNTIEVCRDGNAVGPDSHEWSGSVDRIRTLADRWRDVLATTNLAKPIAGLMPDDTPLWEVAGWVNFELTKNVAEIGQLLTRYSNTET
ncbi:DinB family protein [Rhodococcus phenolicus]|uniref:DinB family protein n=1 Tax=Rhodococcus phenolicus TaxID=263849 RepID=UPI000833A82C|nr:DinB family protein [Rhodococcus phenolicus]